MTDDTHKPRHPRVRTQFEALYSMGRREGAGVLADISYSGAHIEETSMVPEEGTQVRIYVFVQPVSPFTLEGKVVRVTERGFAIAYQDLDDEVRRLVDDAAALVG
ncbi:MAG: PilZ domain-containing protein [Myxococcota bacterium]